MPKSALDKDLKKVVSLETATYGSARSVAAPGMAVLFLLGAMALASVFVADGPLTYLVVIAAVIAGYMALNVGANDVANNMGPAVGSKALTLAGALAIAAVCEGAGAIIAGGDVVSTISRDLLQPHAAMEAIDFILIMMAAFLAAGLWIHLATVFGAPISTTHAIVGGVVGSGVAAAGAGIVAWPMLGAIVASWVISPALGGGIAALLLALVETLILNREDRLAAARRWVPVLVALMSGIFAMYLMTKGLKRLLVLAGPAALIGGITQINLFVGQAIASFKPGAVSILQYADRPYQLPLGMIGVAIGVVLLPELARALKAGHLREAQHTQNRSLEFALFLTLPAAVALFIIPEPIIRVIYERGAFDPSVTPVVASVLGLYALGLPAFVMIKVFSPGYFAREDTKTPMKATLASAGANIVLSLILFWLIAERGIALATTLAGWLNAGLLFAGLYRKGQWQIDRELLKRTALVLVCSLLMGGVLIVEMIELGDWLQPSSALTTQILAIGILVASAMAIYFALALATGAADRRLFLAVLKRKRPPPPPAAS